MNLIIWRKVLCSLLILITSQMSFALDMSSGVKAYDAGRFQEAFANWIYFARRGNAEAQFNIANLYLRGEGVPKDFHKAYVWMLLAAESGLVQAQYNLGVMLLRGDSAEPDQIRAEYWLKLADERGYQSATQLLKNLATERINIAKSAPQEPTVTPMPTDPHPVPSVTPTQLPKVSTPQLYVRFGSVRASENLEAVAKRFQKAYKSRLTGLNMKTEKKPGVDGDFYWIWMGPFASRSAADLWCSAIRDINPMQICFLE